MPKKTLLFPPGTSPFGTADLPNAGILPPANSTSPGSASATPPPHLVGIKEASKMIGCKPVTARRRTKDGSLRYYRIHGRLMFEPGDLRRFVECRRGMPAEAITKAEG